MGGYWDMKKTNILCLLKVGLEEHLKQLVDGRIRCRSLSYYKSIEESGRAHFDENEGIAGIYQASRMKMIFGSEEVGEFEISSETGLVGQVLLSRNYDDPVFCLHAIHTGEWTRDFSEEEIPAFQRYLEMDEKRTRLVAMSG